MKKKVRTRVVADGTEGFFERAREHARKLDRGEELEPAITISFANPADMMCEPRPGDTVILRRLPRGLLNGLSREDQVAINDIVGKPVLLVKYDEDGRAELEFTDAKGTLHSIYVDATAIR